MLLICKVGTKWPSDPYRGWRDGHIVDIRGDEYVPGKVEKKHFAFIRVPVDFWTLRKTTDWKAWNPEIEALKKYLCPVDSFGKYPWEFGVLKDESRLRCRDWFIDYKSLLDQKFIKQQDFQNIYNKDVAQGIFNIDRDFTTLLLHEDEKVRLTSLYTDVKGSIAADGDGVGTGGGFTIGAGEGPDYATVTAFEADIAAQLTGDLHGLHLSEETAISTAVTFDTDTNSHTLYLTAESGAEHNGGAYGNGARIVMGTSDWFELNETNNGELDDFECSNLSFNCDGSNNMGFNCSDGSNNGMFTFNRLRLQNDGGGYYGFKIGQSGCLHVTITNCIIEGFGNGTIESGIYLNNTDSNQVHFICNNTLIGNYNNFYQDGSLARGTMTFKNNLCQADTGGSDWHDDGGGFGTTSKNISEDATSPDEAYRSKNLHTNTIFTNYAADDYRLNSAGDATNLAIADDGDNLYASGVTEDIVLV